MVHVHDVRSWVIEGLRSWISGGKETELLRDSEREETGLRDGGTGGSGSIASCTFSTFTHYNVASQLVF